MYTLNVYYRILFKVATLMHDVFHHCRPAYLWNIVTFTEPDSARSWLWSSTTRSAITVRTRTKLGGRAFSVSGPTMWNSLRYHLNSDSSTADIHFADSQVASVPTSPLRTVLMHHCSYLIYVNGALQILIIIIIVIVIIIIVIVIINNKV